MDINDIDVMANSVDPNVHVEILMNEKNKAIEDLIKSQYIHFDFLGENYLSQYSDDITQLGKVQILQSLIDYVNKNIISIADIDTLSDGVERILLGGQYIYEFVCVDNASSLIPALMEMLNVVSIDDFDNLVNTKYTNDPGKFKTDYLKVIQLTIEQLLKLRKINPVIINDQNYQQLLGKYYYYQDLIDFGDTNMFLDNFIRPVISKYSGDLMWKML